jgi:aminopeptidase N
MDISQTPAPHAPVRLADYRPPDWLVPAIALRFELGAERTLVHARLEVEKNGGHGRPLVLDGDGLEPIAVRVDGRAVPIPNDCASALTLPVAGDRAVVETLVAIRPSANTRLMGLYASGGNLCTQCEPEGFRRISWFPDRPDVLARFRVRLEAARDAFPVLLSNGNLVAEGALPDGRHFAEWDDPFPKPSYLFAAVAGTLSPFRDRFVTGSGREVALAIWVAAHDLPRCAHAMAALKAAMAFDEAEYGREYDLDTFNIVAVHDFNFGAMENKGLNIFNAKYILADPETATDWDLDQVAAVVAHEYFHNWSGNRVTCRDWFQLSLKEGFTVFRDQQFSASLGSASVRRIEEARGLRAFQFAEDAGPMAHPVQPGEYLEINNFYTATVYNKGAELVRMMHRLLGPERYRRACDRYFAANDGRAATIGDFLAAMGWQGLDAERFHRWYRQPGTPVLTATAEADDRGVRVWLSQRNPKAGPDAEPLLIPVDVALFSPSGERVAGPRLVALAEREAAVRFDGVAGPVILSVNRGFSAPVLVEPDPDPAALAVLAAHDDDPFARYDALQRLMLTALLASIEAGRPVGHEGVAAAVARTLADAARDPAFVAEAILVPSEAMIAERIERSDPAAVRVAREALRGAILDGCREALWAAFHESGAPASDLSPRAKGSRRLRGVAISALLADESHEATAAAWLMYLDADGMTDEWAALAALAQTHARERVDALHRFREQWGHDPALMDKWFAVQAGSGRGDTLAVVKRLRGDPAFDIHNPNRVRALLVAFTANPARFHDAEAYRFVADETLLLDPINPSVSSKLAQALTRWRRVIPALGEAMKAELERIGRAPGLSRDVTEVVAKGLA